MPSSNPVTRRQLMSVDLQRRNPFSNSSLHFKTGERPGPALRICLPRYLIASVYGYWSWRSWRSSGGGCHRVCNCTYLLSKYPSESYFAPQCDFPVTVAGACSVLLHRSTASIYTPPRLTVGQAILHLRMSCRPRAKNHGRNTRYRFIIHQRNPLPIYARKTATP